jgi:hypothetical protein
MPNMLHMPKALPTLAATLYTPAQPSPAGATTSALSSTHCLETTAATMINSRHNPPALLSTNTCKIWDAGGSAANAKVM